VNVLDDKQVQFILNDIRRNGIEMEDLQLSLLDHICCVIEEEWSTNVSFEEKYHEVLPRFFKKELSEIQEETKLLLTFKNYYAMKKMMIVSGAISAFGFFIGSMFKIMHWPGAGVLMVLAVAIFSFLFLPILFTLKVKEVKASREKWTLGIGTIVGILFSLSILFKVMHWPGANVMGLSALLGLVFVFLPIHFFGGIRNPETKTNTIVSSVILLAISGFLFLLVNLRGSSASDNALFLANKNLISSTDFLAKSSQDFIAKNEAESLIRIGENKRIAKQAVNVFRETILKQFDHQNYNAQTDEKIIRQSGNAYTAFENLLFTKQGEPSQLVLNLKKSLIKYQQENGNGAVLSLPESMDDDWEMKMFFKVTLEKILRNLNQLELDIELMEMNQLLLNK
jgi:hypothetical protein